MTRKHRKRKMQKRPLDLHGLQNGHYSVIAKKDFEPKGYPISEEAFYRNLRQQFCDIKNSIPSNVPYQIIVDWPSPIRIRAVVLATTQGALIPQDANSTVSPEGYPTLADSALAEAEQIATEAASGSKRSIDVAHSLASEAENRIVPLEEAMEILDKSPDKWTSRKTYGRSRGPKDKIQYADGEEREIGGSKVIPATVKSKETFDLCHCFLSETKQGKFTLLCDTGNDAWRHLQALTPGIDTVKADADSIIVQSLRCMMAAEVPVDMTVCIVDHIPTTERWLEPIRVKDKQKFFAQTRNRLDYLEDALDQ